MSAINKFRNFQRAVNLFQQKEDKLIVFNTNIGWVVTGEHTQKLKSDLLRLSKAELEAEALDNDPASVETWAAITEKYNIH